MKSLYKRFLSIICTLVMVINILPVQVFAVGDDGVKEENAVLPEMTDDEPKSTFDGDTVFSAPKLLTTNAQIIIGGKITDYNGAGLERAAVYVTDATDEIICGKCYTSTSGTWSMSAVSGHKYVIRYHSSRYSFSQDTFVYENVAESTTVPTVTAVALFDDTTETVTSEFTYEILNGSYASITKYTGSSANVVVPEKIDSYIVQKIAQNAFANNKTLESLLLPESVESIGDNAFNGCTALTLIGFDDALTSIGQYAFNGCTGLTTISLPDSVETLGYKAFRNCSNLEDINIALSWNKSGSGVCEGCTRLTSIAVPEGMMALPNNAFNGCESLRSISLPSTLTSIGNKAFDSCSGLSAISIPNGVQTIGSYAFSSCTGLTDIEIPEGVTAIANGLFNGDTGLKGVALPTGIKSIGQYAFNGCTGLTTISLPDSVETLGYKAFRNCSNLQNINIPLGWKEVGYRYSYGDGYIFLGCTKLTSITVPEGITVLPDYAFRGCSSLTSISLPSTLTSIGSYAFSGCSGMSAISIPDSVQSMGKSAFSGCTGLAGIEIPGEVTAIADNLFYGNTGLKNVTLSTKTKSIGDYAFSGCTGLTELSLPDSIETIGGAAFYECSNLQNINIPLGWKEVGYRYSYGDGYIFLGCTKLTSITVPEGITALPNYAFRGCSSLTSISLPSTLTSIGNYAFSGCTKLRYIEPVDGLLSIGSYSFSECTKLEFLYLPDTVTSYGTNIFQNSKKLTVECKEYSFATIYCIDADIPVEFIGESFENSTSLCLNRNNTYYVANTVGALSNGYITMNIGYEYRPDVANSISSQSLSIHIPSDMALIEKTLKLDGNLLAGYDYSNNLLTVVPAKVSGNISFSLKPTGDSIVTTYAVMNFKNNGVATKEVIGIINERLPLLTIQANDEVNSSTVAVTGVGAADKDVSLYIDGALVGTARTNKSGTYSTRVTIPSASDYATYTITAKTSDVAGNEISASKEILYSTGAPVLQSFTMRYGENTYDILALGTTKPTITFELANQFSFDVKFSNPSQIEKVYVCSTRSNVTKRMEAIWDSATSAYHAAGYFDSSNKSYVPGKITVEYTRVSEKIDFGLGVDYTSTKYVNGVSAPIKAMLNGKVTDCVENLISDDKQLSGVIKMVDANALLDFNILTDVIPSYLDPSNASRYGYEVMEDDYGAKLYLKVAEYAEDKVRGEIIDFTHDKITSFLIKGEHINTAANVDSYFSFVDALGYANKLITWDNNRISLSEAKQAILSSSMTTEQQAAALKKLDNASKSNNAVVAAMALPILLSAAGIAIPFPANLILPLLSMQSSAYVNDVLGQFGFLGASESEGASFNYFIWKIDPSGYVYDNDTNERLAGVTTTVYWIAFDEKDENTQPSDDEYGMIWAADEWDQINPILTDDKGRYAWDVPEGWWRVKYEKKGYNTVWSNWMPVPPPQTDVNIGMTSNVADSYALAVTSSSATSTTVMLTNNAGTTASIQYVLAAYTANDRMVTYTSATRSMQDKQSVSLTVSYSGNDNVTHVQAFVLQSGTLVPLRDAWSSKLAS